MSDFISWPKIAVSRTAFLTTIWITWSVATACTVGRLLTRWKVFKRIAADDVMVILAWAASTAFTAEWHAFSSGAYKAMAQQSGEAPFDLTYWPHLKDYIHIQTAALICSGLGFWFIKLSFLLFFRNIGKQLRQHVILWWSVTVFVILIFPVYFSMSPWFCHEGLDHIQELTARCNVPKIFRFTVVGLKVSTVIDILTDVAILTIPFTILWRVRLTLQKKLALGGLFSLTLFIILSAILKVTITMDHTNKSGQMDVTWLYLWYKIELDTAITVAGLASFRALFTAQSEHQRLANYRSSSIMGLRGMSYGIGKSDPKSTNQSREADQSQCFSHAGSDDALPLAPPDRVRVRTDYIVHAEP